VTFRINKGGELSDLSIDHPSGLAIADQAALKAIENAAPFRSLPVGPKDHVE
jgi:TonB family protein